MRRVRSTEHPVERSEMRKEDGLWALAREATGLPISTSAPAFASFDAAVLSTLATLDGPAGTVKPAKREIEVRLGHLRGWQGRSAWVGGGRACWFGGKRPLPLSSRRSRAHLSSTHSSFSLYTIPGQIKSVRRDRGLGERWMRQRALRLRDLATGSLQRPVLPSDRPSL